MAKKEEESKEKKLPPATPAMIFLTGLLIFTAILSPAGVLFSFIIRLNRILGVKFIYSLSLGCLAGVVLAIIPALIFMRLALKKMKKR